MITCAHCGRQLGAAARFCPQCGTPTGPALSPDLDGRPDGNPSLPVRAAPRRAHGALPALGLAVVIVLVGAGAFWAAQALKTTASAGPSTTESPRAGATGQPRPTPTASSQVAEDTSADAPSPASAQAALDNQVATDRATVEGLVGYWVPQLSSKRLGLVWQNTTYGYPEILADFRGQHDRFPTAVLLRSDDYSSFRTPGFWVTVLAQPFPTPEAANDWCDGQGLTPDDCFAKRLSHTEGSVGNTVPR